MRSKILSKFFLLLIFLSVSIIFFVFYKPTLYLPISFDCYKSSEDFSEEEFAKKEALRMLFFEKDKDFCIGSRINYIEEGSFSETFDTVLYGDNHIDRQRMYKRSVLLQRNKFLAELVKNSDEILSIPPSLQRYILEHNLKKIDQYLSYSKVYTQLIQQGANTYDLIIEPDSNAEIKLTKIEFSGVIPDKVRIEYIGKTRLISTDKLNEYFSIFPFTLHHDEKLELKKSRYIFRISGENLKIDKFTPKYENTFKNFEVSPRDNNFVLIKKPDKYYEDYIFQSNTSFLVNHKNLNLTLDGNLFTLKSGSYFLDYDLIFPIGASLVIDPGVKITMSNGSSIILYGDLTINGELLNPVEITRGKTNFGVVAAIGDEATTINISFLNLSGGTESIINGAYLSGALSLYGHKTVNIKNTNLFKNLGEDGLNIKNSFVIIENSNFFDNASDQVDLDNGEGLILNNKFSRTSLTLSDEQAKNGDGLDLSGFSALVEENVFDSIQDKGVSVGEQSSAFFNNNIFINNNIGIANKDGSIIYINHNDFRDNKKNISQYIKKNFFPAPFTYFKETSFNEMRNLFESKEGNSFLKGIPEEVAKLYLSELKEKINQQEIQK